MEQEFDSPHFHFKKGKMDNIKISNIVYDSFQEYQGESSLVLFLSHCNLKCPKCYNLPYMDREIMEAKRALDVFQRPNHAAVVFLGGEPTVWDELPELVKYAKNEKGLKTKIYTNGQSPKVLLECAPYLDAVSIDFKAFSGVSKIIGKDILDHIYMHNIFLCISKLKNYNKYTKIEVRTTKWEGVEYKKIRNYLKTIWPEIPHILQEPKEYK